MKQFGLTSEKNRSDDSPIPLDPFRLDLETQNQPSNFELTFKKGGASYVYGFIVNSRRVIEEWLHSYPVGRRRILFERNLNGVAYHDTHRKSLSRESSSLARFRFFFRKSAGA